MRLAVAGLDAVRILRGLRCEGVDIARLPRAPLCTPDPSPFQRMRSGRLDLEALRLAQPPSKERRLAVAVPSPEQAVRAGFIRNVVVNPDDVPRDSFMEIGGGIQIPCPELLFVQMGACMLTPIHLAFGMELCGGFSRDAAAPLEGDAAFDLRPATSRERVLAYLASCRNVTGATRARKLGRLVCDNAWSPTEAAIAALLVLPWHEVGYGLGPLELNKRVTASGPMARGKSSRVPDILFSGTRVGFNYDGGGHLDLDRVAGAASQAALMPDDARTRRDLGRAIGEVRAKYADDRRRDRELWSQGYEVMPVMSEDLREEGGLDRLVSWAIGRLEAQGAEANKGRDLASCRKMLSQPIARRMRQQLVWSLLPGERGREARKAVAREYTSERPRPTVTSAEVRW